MKMNYDHTADENGVFEMVITTRDDAKYGDVLKRVKITGLTPFEEVNVEIMISDEQTKRDAEEIDAALSRPPHF